MRCWSILVFSLFAGCDAAEETPQGSIDAAAGCAEADLVAQCPVGSNPVIGARAEACDGAVGGLVSDAMDQVTGQCLGGATCRALCQFAVPCRCGVAEVTRAGVTCAPCDDAASCGDDVCEGGESPETCPIDCGAVCAPDERRCDGDALEACSLQGRWERLDCPRDEVCTDAEGEARCARDVEIIGGEDAGLGEDAGPPPDEGRVIPGEGTLPAITPALQGATGRRFGVQEFSIRLVDGSVNNRPTRFAQAQLAIAGNAGQPQSPRPAAEVQLWLVPGDPGRLEALSVKGRFYAAPDGTVELPEREFVADPDAFCADTTRCFNTVIEDCAAYVAQEIEQRGPTRVQCVAETIASGEQADCLAVLLGDACGWDPRLRYPEGIEFGGRSLARRGARVVGVSADRRAARMVDLELEAARAMEPVGEFVLNAEAGRFDVSADGRVAAFVARGARDEVIVVWDIEAGDRRPLLPGSGASISGLRLSPDGQVLVMRRTGTGDAAVDGLVSVWNLATEQRIFSVRPMEGGGFGVAPALSPDGRHLAIALRNPNVVELWDLTTRERSFTLDYDPRIPEADTGFTPDGALLAVSYEGPEAPMHLWEVATGQRIFSRGGTALPRFQPDGRRAISAVSALGILDLVILNGP